MYRSKERGFTFLEIMLVVVIIGILAAIVGPSITGRTEKAKRAAAAGQITNFETALKNYELDVGEFPSTTQGLKALIEKPPEVPDTAWDGPYLDKNYIPLDPWKRPYVYKSPGEHNKNFDLYSIGKDGQEGTEDDIVNWATGAEATSASSNL